MSTLTKHLVAAISILVVTSTGMIVAEVLVPGKPGAESASEGIFMLGFSLIFGIFLISLFHGGDE